MIKKELTCSHDKTLLEALDCINTNLKRVVFIVNEKKELIGILTDGDIRRLLLEGEKLTQVISKCIKPEFVFARLNETYEEMWNKCSEQITILPIVDDKMQVIDYFEYESKIYVPVAHPLLSGNELSYLIDAFSSTWISSTGFYINQFEGEFAKFCGMKYGIAVSNGTAALHLALVALGIGAGDEVIVPDLTFAATINVVIYTGATPVIVDIEEDSWCIDSEEIRKAINEKTKAIIPVHIYGQPCNMEEICQIAKDNNLFIIEDCAEAHGAEYREKKVGSFSDVSCFSFFGNKIITTGEGGMCLTNSKELVERMKQFRDHGMNRARKYYHDVVGYNYRMTNLQAAIGLGQVEKISECLAWRTNLEDIYVQKLNSFHNIQLQKRTLPDRKKVTWLVSVLVDKKIRDEILEYLKENGIDSRPFFTPLSEMDIYKKYVFSNRNSQQIAPRGINLPTSYEIKEDVIDRIVSVLAQFYHEK